MPTPLRARWLCVASMLGLAAACGPQEPPDSGAQPAAAAPADPVAARAHVTIDNAMAGWVASGLTVAKGDEAALFADGKLEAEGIVFGTKFLVWYRVGETGDAANLVADQDTFVAPADGEVFRSRNGS